MKNIYILVDISLSIVTTKKHLIQSLNEYIDMHRNDHVSIYFFNHEIDCILVNPYEISDKHFDFRGRTALWDILNIVMDKATWDIFPEFIIISDCRDTASIFHTEDEMHERMFYKKLIGWTFKIYTLL